MKIKNTFFLVCFFTIISASEENIQLMGDRETKWTNAEVSADMLPLEIWQNITSHMEKPQNLTTVILQSNAEYKNSEFLFKENLQKTGEYYGLRAIQQLHAKLSGSLYETHDSIPQMCLDEPDEYIFDPTTKEYEKISGFVLHRIKFYYNNFIANNCTKYFLLHGNINVLIPELVSLQKVNSDVKIDYKEDELVLDGIRYNIKSFKDKNHQVIKIANIPLHENRSIDEDKFSVLVNALIQRYGNIDRLVYEKDTKCPTNLYEIPIIQNKKGNTILHEAIIANKTFVEIESILNNLEKNVLMLNTKNYEGVTPLMLAIQYDWCDVVNTLIDLGADLKICDNRLDSPLHYAVNSSYEMIYLLLNKGAPVNFINNYNQTPLLKYCKQVKKYSHLQQVKKYSHLNDIRILQALLDAHSNPNQKKTFSAGEYSYKIPLYYFLSEKDKREEVRLLLEAGADPTKLITKRTTFYSEHKVHTHISLLNQALKNSCDNSTIKLLIEYKARPDEDTLKTAIDQNNFDLISWLMDNNLLEDKTWLEKYKEPWVVALRQNNAQEAKKILWWKQNGNKIVNLLGDLVHVAIIMSIYFKFKPPESKISQRIIKKGSIFVVGGYFLYRLLVRPYVDSYLY